MASRALRTILAAAALAARAPGSDALRTPRRSPNPRMATPTATTDRTTLGTLDIPALGIGTLNWPLDKRQDPDAAAAMRACVARGVDLFDTAEAYGFGRSEELVRDCAAKAGAPITVATKFAPVPWRMRASDVVDACRASAARLGLQRIPLYQIHFPDIIQPLAFLGLSQAKDEAFWDGLAQCYEEGLVENVGVSNYGPKLLARCQGALEARGVPLASNQINFSLLYRKQGAQATADWCADRGIKVLGYFPLANGLLAGKYHEGSLPPGFKGRAMRKYVEGGVTERGVVYPKGGATPLVRVMREVAEARGKTVPQVALNYVMCKGVVPIPGCRNARMAEDNAGALGWRLDPGEVASLEAAADALGFEFSGGGFGLVED